MNKILIVSFCVLGLTACSKKSPPDLRTPVAQAQNKAQPASDEVKEETKSGGEEKTAEDLSATLSADLKPYLDVIQKITEKKFRVTQAMNALAQQNQKTEDLKKVDPKTSILEKTLTGSDQKVAGIKLLFVQEKGQQHSAVAEGILARSDLVTLLKESSDLNVAGISQVSDPREGKTEGKMTVIVLMKADTSNAATAGKLGPDPHAQQRGASEL